MAEKANRINFTREALERLPLPAPGTRATWHDSKARGLQLRITDRGTRTFSCYRWIPGDARPERITLGKFPGLAIDDARRLAEKYAAEIAAGGNPGERKRALRKELTLADLFRLYIERHGRANKRTWEEDENRFRLYFGTLAGRKLSHIRRADLARLHSDISTGAPGLHAAKAAASRRTKPRGIDAAPRPQPTTANRVLAMISGVFSWAIKAGVFEGENPARNIAKNRERSRDRWLQSGELPRFFEALRAEGSGNARDFYLLLLLTGARRGNVMAMRWRDVDLERAEWRIPETKNGTPQVVALVPEAVTLLQDRLTTAGEGAEYVFPGTGRAGHMCEPPRKAWLRILKRAGLEDVRIHDLRRTVGSWAARTGASLLVIGKALNHKSPAATAVYARLDVDPVREAMERATAGILEAAGIKTRAPVKPIKRTRAA